MERFSSHRFAVARPSRRGGVAAVVAALGVVATAATLAGCSSTTDMLGPSSPDPSLAKSPGGAALVLSISPTVVSSGTPAEGTVTLGSPAPAKGTTLALVSSDPATAAVPASVTVPRGQTTATFPITTGPASGAPTTITASQGRTASSAQLTVTAPDLVSLVLDPGTIRVTGTSTGTVTLTGPAPSSGLLVTLVTSDPAAVISGGGVLVPAGQTSATFPVLGVSAAPSVTITGSLGTTTRSAQLTILHVQD